MNQRVPNKSADLLKKISLIGTEICTFAKYIMHCAYQKNNKNIAQKVNAKIGCLMLFSFAD